MKEDIPPRMYSGPRQEKQYRKNQRQLHLKEVQEVGLSDEQESTSLVVLPEYRTVPEVATVVLPEVEQYPPKTASRTNWPLVGLACTLFLVTLGNNASVAWDRGTTVLDKAFMSSLGGIFEAMLFFLPSQASRLWMQHRWISSVLASILGAFLFVSGLMASLAFASLNLTDTTTARAERITPAVSDAQRRLDTLTASRKDECLKRGDRCRQLEKDEQTALEALEKAREKVSATSDPQIAAAAKLIAWVSLDRFHPSADDFAMLRLLLLTLLPQLGGLVLMVAKRA